MAVDLRETDDSLVLGSSSPPEQAKKWASTSPFATANRLLSFWSWVRAPADPPKWLVQAQNRESGPEPTTNSRKLLVLDSMEKDIVRLHHRFCQEALVIRNLRPATARWYARVFAQFMRTHGAGVSTPSDMTTERLREYLYGGRLNGWKATTFWNQYKALKAFMAWCVKHELLRDNPIAPIERPKLEKRIPRRISEEDARRLLEYAFHADTRCRFQRYRDRAILATMLFAGLRAQECLDLRLGNVNVDGGTILVENGKGAKDRFVPIGATLRRYLSDYLADRARLRKESPYLFTTLQGNGRFTYTGLKRLVQRLRDGTGIEAGMSRPVLIIAVAVSLAG